MTRGAPLGAAIAISLATIARAALGAPPELPPPPPPSTPQYEPPPPPSQVPPPRREPAPRRERPSPPPAQPEPSPSPTPRRYVPPPTERYERDEAPDARTGLQIALRTGLSLPAGSITGQNGDPMSTDFKAQVPLFAEIGFKVTPNIFLGGTLGLAFGGAGNDFRARAGCDQATRSCMSTDLRLGAEVQYHFHPDDRWNPWIGLGLGFESATASASGNGPGASENFTGFEFLKLSGGIDFRATRLLGVGPFVSLDVGEYGHAHAESGGGVADGSIQNPAMHEWLTLGVRVVFFP